MFISLFATAVPINICWAANLIVEANLIVTMEEEPMNQCKRVKITTDPDVNPLLVGLVLEKVFPYCKTWTGKWINLSEYRLVCKTWDKELAKKIREDTQINVSKFLIPFPDGFGWQAPVAGGGEPSYHCPYPVTTFENVEVTANCPTLSNTSLIKWFQTMGSNVKSLKYNSEMKCYHHVRFLECVLKFWCKNLKRLYLTNVECIFTLLHNSKFVDKLKPIICDLEEVVISVEGLTPGPTQSLFRSCEEDLPTNFLNFSGATNILVTQDDPAFRTFGLKILKRMTRNFTENLSQESLDFFRNTVACNGGILGEIFRNGAVKKFVINKLSTPNQIQDLLTFLNVRELNTKKTLTHFEYDDLPLAFNSLYLDAFRMVKLPLTTMHFGMLFAFDIRNSLKELIASFADTLEHLEFVGTVMLQDWVIEHDEEYIEINLPLLPKLKSFLNGNIFTCRMGGLEFLKQMPNLEKCSLTNTIYHSSIFPLTPAEVFNLLFQVCYFETPHPIKELTLKGKICYNSHVDLMHNWFQNLKKVDLVLEGADVFVDFLRVAKNINIEDIKVSFYSNDNEWCNAGIVNNIPKMTNLKFLQLIHLPDSPLTISLQTCAEGFSKAVNLTSLKLSNFGFFMDEIKKIITCLSHISCVEFNNTVFQYKPVTVECSVGCEMTLPFKL